MGKRRWNKEGGGDGRNSLVKVIKDQIGGYKVKCFHSFKYTQKDGKNVFSIVRDIRENMKRKKKMNCHMGPSVRKRSSVSRGNKIRHLMR